MNWVLRKLGRVQPTTPESTASVAAEHAPLPAPPVAAASAVERVYLEFREGTSSKFYAVVRLVHEDGTESVAFNYGRIGFPRGWDHRARRVAPQDAAATFVSLVAEKRRKGYGDAPWPATMQDPIGGAEPLVPPFAAAKAGVLPPTGAVTVAGVALPVGRPLPPGELSNVSGGAPFLWITDSPAPNPGALWSALAEAYPRTGLWPLIIDNPALDDVLTDHLPASSRPVAEILEGAWAETFGYDEDPMDPEVVAPFSKGFPGLAAPTTGASTNTVFAACAHGLQGHLGLVPVMRPADALGALGWQGWANYGFDAGEMSAVFRSWEERFGAVLVGLGFDVLTLAVARPPRNLAEATAIAAELTAVCPDNVLQGTDSIRAYAHELVHGQVWPFWWD